MVSNSGSSKRDAPTQGNTLPAATARSAVTPPPHLAAQASASVRTTRQASETPRPLPTGHAATAAQWRAIAAYPRLGIAGSEFNLMFLETVKKAQIERMEIFDNPEWPTAIARECSHKLNAAVGTAQ